MILAIVHLGSLPVPETAGWISMWEKGGVYILLILCTSMSERLDMKCI